MIKHRLRDIVDTVEVAIADLYNENPMSFDLHEDLIEDFALRFLERIAEQLRQGNEMLEGFIQDSFDDEEGLMPVLTPEEKVSIVCCKK